MAEFGAAATLEVTIPDRELRQARRKIERELGDVTVGVDARGARGARADGGAHRDTLGTGATGVVGSAGRGLVQVKQLEKLDDILEVLEKGAVDGGGDGGGGGGPIPIPITPPSIPKLPGVPPVPGVPSVPGVGVPTGPLIPALGPQLADFINDVREALGNEPIPGTGGPGPGDRPISASTFPDVNLLELFDRQKRKTGGVPTKTKEPIKSTFSEGARAGAKERHERFSRQQNITINNEVTVKGSTERDVERAMDRAKRQTKEELRRELARKGGGARVR